MNFLLASLPQLYLSRADDSLLALALSFGASAIFILSLALRSRLRQEPAAVDFTLSSYLAILSVLSAGLLSASPNAQELWMSFLRSHFSAGLYFSLFLMNIGLPLLGRDHFTQIHLKAAGLPSRALQKDVFRHLARGQFVLWTVLLLVCAAISELASKPIGDVLPAALALGFSLYGSRILVRWQLKAMLPAQPSEGLQ